MTYPAIQNVYNTLRQKWVGIVAENVDETGLHLAGDAGFSAVGHQAKFCKYILLDVDTKLIIDYTILDKRRENGEHPNKYK